MPGKEVTGQTRLIMILKKVKHVRTNIVHPLPTQRYVAGTALPSRHTAQAVIQAHLIIKIVKQAAIDILTVKRRIIRLRNKQHAGVTLLHPPHSPGPELHRHHLRHVAAKGINTLASPIKQNMQHLMPRIRHRIKVAHATTAVVNAVIKLHRLIPVIPARMRAEAVVASRLGRHLFVGNRLRAPHVKAARQTLAWDIIEIVLRTKSLTVVIILPKVADTLRLHIRHIVARHMVRHKVHHHLQARTVSPVHQSLKLSHAPLRPRSQVRINVIVILNRIRRTRATLNHSTVIALNAQLRIVRLSGMLQQTSVPDVAHTKRLQLTQRQHSEVTHQTTAVLLTRAVRHRSSHPVAEQTGQHLIDNNLLHSKREVTKKNENEKKITKQVGKTPKKD